MKTTGLVVLLIGVAVALFCGIAMLGNSPADPSTTTAAGVGLGRGANIMVPLIVAIGAMAVGTYMLMYGGRGYYVSQNPSVRN